MDRGTGALERGDRIEGCGRRAITGGRPLAGDPAAERAYASARTAEVQVRQFEDLLLADGRDAIRTRRSRTTRRARSRVWSSSRRCARCDPFSSSTFARLLNYELALTDLEVEEQP